MPWNIQSRKLRPDVSFDIPRPDLILGHVSGLPAGNDDAVFTDETAGQVIQIGEVFEGLEVGPAVGGDVEEVDGDDPTFFRLSPDEVDSVLPKLGFHHFFVQKHDLEATRHLGIKAGKPY